MVIFSVFYNPMVNQMVDIPPCSSPWVFVSNGANSTCTLPATSISPMASQVITIPTWGWPKATFYSKNGATSTAGWCGPYCQQPASNTYTPTSSGGYVSWQGYPNGTTTTSVPTSITLNMGLASNGFTVYGASYSDNCGDNTTYSGGGGGGYGGGGGGSGVGGQTVGACLGGVSGSGGGAFNGVAGVAIGTANNASYSGAGGAGGSASIILSLQ